ncbi:MAG: GGDEF domain-containing protein [Oricola sp.]
MHLDPMTLMIPAVIANAFAAALLFGSWLRFRTMYALLWWGAAKTFHASALALLTVGFLLDRFDFTMAGLCLSGIAPTLNWAGARQFQNLPISLPLVAAGPLMWLVTMIAGGPDGVVVTTILNLAIWFVYLSAAVVTLLANREEKLPARWLLAGTFALHAAIYLGGIVEVLRGTFNYGAPSFDTWFGIIHFETILYAMGTAISMLLLCKERQELGYMEAARIDPLTGTANRSAFFEHSRRLYDRCLRESIPFSLIMFDLDRFKRINDSFGHQFGDRILRDFAETVRLSIRPNDLFGRYGGEEFVVVLPGASIETAVAIAERIRQQFADDNKYVDGRPVGASVSAGVATTAGDDSIDDVIRAADEAMYVAKRTGRNRVERAPGAPSANDSGIIRIA